MADRDKLTEEITIIVNGELCKFSDKEISYEAIIDLAYGKEASETDVRFTITYRDGHDGPSRHVLGKGCSIKVKEKMKINVARPDKS